MDVRPHLPLQSSAFGQTAWCSLTRRRRPGLYRYCRNHPRLEPRRKHHHHLHQQCHLWYDGGQMAPTTLVGMKTSTSPYGRDVHLHGYPLKMADIAAQLEGTAYVTRQAYSPFPPSAKRKRLSAKHSRTLWQAKVPTLWKSFPPVTPAGRCLLRNPMNGW